MQPNGYVEDHTDCDDTSALVNPLTLIGMMVNQNCDGLNNLILVHGYTYGLIAW